MDRTRAPTDGVSTQKRDYVKPGMRLRLADDHRASALPEWRAVQFTLILSFPTAGLPQDQAAHRFTSLGKPGFPDATGESRRSPSPLRSTTNSSLLTTPATAAPSSV